ncbi:MAG: epoxyqueuosine reductase QueH [Clostridia bacterium]|nr:epoxyqueuosine reductase QueH [Clostridia bacterium]
MKENYNLLMENEIEGIKEKGSKPTLLLQCCCAPCSSAVLERLKEHFHLKLYFYNPNIYPAEEYEKRLSQFDKLLASPDFKEDTEFVTAAYESEKFDAAAKGLESEKEGGKRCEACFRLRLFETAKKAKEIGADYFCTTLTVSPHKNSALLNEIGIEAEKQYGVKFLYSDFKKKEGYKRSTELSNKLSLYRQNYCGCKYSIWFE